MPDGGWGGGVIMRSLTQNTPPHVSINWTTFDASQNKSTSDYANIKIIPFKPSYIRGQAKFKFIRELDSIRFAADLNSIIKENNINLLWIVLGVTYNELFRLSILSLKLIIPYHLTIHDDPIVELDKSKKKKGTALFQTILSHAKTIDVVSIRMQNNYKQQYNAESIVITRGIPPTFSTNHLRAKDSVQLIMGGYGNVSSPWPLHLIEAVKLMQKDQSSTLHLFDSKLTRWKNEYVKVYENLPESDFDEILKSIHIGYACDDLSEDCLSFAQLSLPTKIITYIGAGIPFVYHGPKDSTVGDLLVQFDAGIIVSTNNSVDLYNAFNKILINYSYYQQNCFHALQKKFASSIVQSNFYNHLLKP